MIDDLRKVIITICHWIIQLIRICTPQSWQQAASSTNNNNSNRKRIIRHNGKAYYDRQRINDALGSAAQSAKRYSYITDLFGRWGKLYLLRHWYKHGLIRGYDDEGLYITLQQPSPILRSEQNWRLAQWDWDEPIVESQGVYDNRHLTFVPQQHVGRRSMDRWLKSLGYHGWDGRGSREWSP